MCYNQAVRWQPRKGINMETTQNFHQPTARDRNLRAYDRACDAWAAIRHAAPVNRCVAELSAQLAPGSRVLDIGCGTGEPIAAWLAGQSFRVTGIDLSPRMIARAQALNLPGAAFQVCDVLAYRPQAPFDAAIAFDSLWHVPQQEQAALYPKLSACLRPGGLLLFTHGCTDSCVQGEMLGETFYYSALGAQRVRELLTQNGFEILSFIQGYAEPTTGTRDLLVTARKRGASR